MKITNDGMTMIKALYDWTMRLGTSKYGFYGLMFIAFIESSFFPIPPDILLIPMVLSMRSKAFTFAFWATVASVAGGVLGYGIGMFGYDVIGKPLLAFYNYETQFESFKTTFNEWGAWAVFVTGVTPFPYKVITITSGVTELNFTIFMLTSIAARGARFFLVAGLLYYFGEPIRNFIEKYLGPLFIVFCILLVGSFALIKYV